MAILNRTPKQDERFVNSEGLAMQQFYRWCQWVTDKLTYGEPPEYANLADINEKISKPRVRQMVFVTGQGLAIYVGSQWVKASDGVTAIA
jgi:hypothetical protein